MADEEDALEVEQAVRETEKEILDKAFSPPEEKPEEPEAPVQEGRTRDPQTGRFTKAAPEGEAPAGEQAPEEEKPEEHVPSWRLREINEEKRRIEAERDQMRTEFARMQAQIAQFQRAQQAQQAPPPPDPVLDPQGFARQVREEMRAEFFQQQASDRLTMNLEMAHLRHGDKFEKAYEALIVEGQRGNSQLVRHFVAQPNPGEAIVRWHTQNELLREVGADLPAYKQKTRDELLKDPEFLAQAVEAHHRLATGGQSQPNTVVKLPPSLSKATGNAEQPSGPQPRTDGSESQIFAYAMQPKPRR